jgi:hypothetical protein
MTSILKISKMIPVLIALFGAFSVLSTSASADVVVGVRAAQYGNVIVVGHPNPDVQRDVTFSVQVVTVGSKSEDTGTIDGKPLNEKIRLRAGQYTISFDGTSSTLEVVAGQTTVVKLQRVTASPLEGTRFVSLYQSDALEADNNCDAVGTFVRKEHKMVYDSPGCAFFCNSSYHYNDIVRSWRAAYFYVLPGTYSMRWTLEDGTTHQEDKITVQ